MSAPTPSPERREVGKGNDIFDQARMGRMGRDPRRLRQTGSGDLASGEWFCTNATCPMYGFNHDGTPCHSAPAPSPDPRSPEDGRGAPTPFETFQAGMFAGIMAERVAGRDPQDWTEDEVRREFRDWLEERAAATPANRATR